MQHLIDCASLTSTVSGGDGSLAFGVSDVTYCIQTVGLKVQEAQRIPAPEPKSQQKGQYNGDFKRQLW